MPAALRRHASCGSKVRRKRSEEDTVNTFLWTLARLAVAKRYVFMPMGKLFYIKKIVKCPESDEPAEILVDTTPSTSAKPKKKLFSIRHCSLWPKRKNCTQSCEK